MARIIFMGTPRFAVTILQALIANHQVVALVTQPDQRAGRGRRELLPPPTKEVAQAHGVRVIQPRSLRRPQVVAELRALGAEAIVVAAFGQILKADVLSLPPHGCLNVHASLLPRYRGAAPISAAILAGEAETGVTIMLMDEGMDSGPILARAALPIEPTDTTGSLTERLATLGAALLLETLPRWLRGEIVPQPQDEHLATYCRPLKKEDGGIDWAWPAERIGRMVRAYDPWPGAYTFLAGKPLKILRARPRSDWVGRARPGEVIRLREGFAVATGAGALLLEEIQPAGKRAMACQAFACGQRDFVGATLGNLTTETQRRRE